MARTSKSRIGKSVPTVHTVESLCASFPELKPLVAMSSASDTQIRVAFTHLPEILRRMPPERRNSLMTSKMICALRAGVFDCAINHAWNLAIGVLRSEVHKSDVHLMESDFDAIIKSDRRVLSLCRSIGIIDESTYFKLGQCLATRHRYSVAHEAIGAIDEFECLAHISICCCFELRGENSKAIDIAGFMKAINEDQMKDEQRKVWVTKITDAFEEQRNFVLTSLYGMHCDPTKPKSTRTAALGLCLSLKQWFSGDVLREVRDIHEGYRLRGEEVKCRRSRWLHIALGIAAWLSEEEYFETLREACTRLDNIHESNDPDNPLEVSRAAILKATAFAREVPDSIVVSYVQTVLTGAIGYEGGVNKRAEMHYREMIEAFSEDQIRVMFSFIQPSSPIGERFDDEPFCEDRFHDLVGWLKPEDVPSDLTDMFEKWRAEE